jgi:hypothetical protein
MPSLLAMRATHDVVRLQADTPASTYAALFAHPRSADELFSVTCTSDEISVLLPTRLNTLSSAANVKVESDWMILKVRTLPVVSHTAYCLAHTPAWTYGRHTSHYCYTRR